MEPTFEVWGENAPPLHDASVVALRHRAGVVELDLQLDEEHAWATLHLHFILTGDRAPSWERLERLLAVGVEPELMSLNLESGVAHIGLAVEPPTSGVRWLDVRERVSTVLYRLKPAAG
ncbi:hypothetical protein LBMAG42_34170 [Deltaproteobacteria bacterium]|nr:hypothetical protein LBMAG42_34170 [Deltaproteobacteria bacterium]